MSDFLRFRATHECKAYNIVAVVGGSLAHSAIISTCPWCEERFGPSEYWDESAIRQVATEAEVNAAIEFMLENSPIF